MLGVMRVRIEVRVFIRKGYGLKFSAADGPHFKLVGDLPVK